MHTNIHTHTHAQTVKIQSSVTLNLLEIALNYVNCIGITESIEFNVKQLANRPAHLPRVQAPVHMNMLDGAPGVHHKRRPQGMTKMTQNTLNYFKFKRASKQIGKIDTKYKIHKTMNFQQKLTIFTWKCCSFVN